MSERVPYTLNDGDYRQCTPNTKPLYSGIQNPDKRLHFFTENAQRY